MGYIKHNAIVVTTWQKDGLRELEMALARIGVKFCTQDDQSTNGYMSVLVCPDGSKEGWEESANGDERRDLVCAWLDEQRREERFWFEWVEIAYSPDDCESKVVRDAWGTQTDEPSALESSANNEVVNK